MRAQKEQGCWVRECVWCCSLINVTVRVSLLEDPRPYCSSRRHCPLTHMTYPLSLTHTHTHTVQWLRFPFLLSPSVIFFPLLSFYLLFPSPLLLYSLSSSSSCCTSTTAASRRLTNCDDHIVFAPPHQLTKYRWLSANLHRVIKYSKLKVHLVALSGAFNCWRMILAQVWPSDVLRSFYNRWSCVSGEIGTSVSVLSSHAPDTWASSISWWRPWDSVESIGETTGWWINLVDRQNTDVQQQQPKLHRVPVSQLWGFIALSFVSSVLDSWSDRTSNLKTSLWAL